MRLAAIAVAVSLSACSAAQVKQDEAEAGYLAQQLRCVDQSTTRAQADACRAAVRRAWGVGDAGPDAADAATDAEGGAR